MGPDFHGGQKTTKKNFPTKVTNKDKNNSNLAWTLKKIQKNGSQIHCHKKNFPLKWQRK